MWVKAKDDDEDWAIDLWDSISFHRWSPLNRWLINRRRRREGKEPFPWFEPTARH